VEKRIRDERETVTGGKGPENRSSIDSPKKKGVEIGGGKKVKEEIRGGKMQKVPPKSCWEGEKGKLQERASRRVREKVDDDKRKID